MLRSSQVKELKDRAKKKAKVFKKREKKGEVEKDNSSDIEDGETVFKNNPLVSNKKTTEIGGRPFGGIGSDGRGDIRDVSITEVEIGGDVVSKHEKYKRRAEEAKNDFSSRMAQLKQGFSNGSKMSTKKAPEKVADSAREETVTNDTDTPPPTPQSNWDRFIDEDSGHEYFQNRISGESTWERPDGYNI